MQNIVCLKIVRFFSALIALVFMAGGTAEAQTRNKIRDFTVVNSALTEIKYGEGSPVEIKYTDGRVAQMVRKEKVDFFRAPVVLKENSCQTTIGLKCTFVLPFIRQSYAAVWKAHPSRQGQPLEYENNKGVTLGAQTFVTRTQNEIYEKILNRMLMEGGDKAAINAALKEKNLGRFECDGEVATAFPNGVKEILFFDENYEGGNPELALAEGFGARVNYFWRRYQNVALKFDGKVMHLAPFRIDYGMMTDSKPTGLAYLLRFSFRAPNIEQPKKPYCTVNWLVDFSNYFTQILDVISNGGFKPFNPAGYRPYVYSYENPSYYAREPFKTSIWDHESVQ